jgi:hypothetical protein
MLIRRLFIAASLATLATTGGARAQGQSIVGIATTTTYTADARITAVDPGARTVTLTFSNGAVATHKVSPAVSNFGGSRIGDMVSVAFEEKRTFVLSGPNTKVPVDRSVSAAAVATTGNAMGGVAAGKSITNWWVTSVDPAAAKISLVDPAGGEVRTYNVANEEGRAQLPRVKPGDNLTVVNADVLVIAITPKA